MSAEIPALGFGTYMLQGEVCRNSVLMAIANGIRLIDTASVYKNEEEVGMAIRQSGIPRESLYVTTKVNPREAAGGKSAVLAAVQNSLVRLGMNYVDCAMLHWPGISGIEPSDARNTQQRLESFAALHEAQRAGLCRHIGVSNFQPAHLEQLPFPPAVHQFELHPVCRQRDVVCATKAVGCVVQQYSPIARNDPRMTKHPAIEEICQRMHLTPQKFAIAWGCSKFDSMVLTTRSEAHLKENLEAYRAAENIKKAMGSSNPFDFDFEGPDVHVCWNSSSVE